MKKKPAVRSAKPYKKVSPQWEDVHRYREILNDPSPPPPIRRLKNSWARIEASQRPLLDLDNCGSPLEAIILCITDGRYPPPDLLLGFCNSYNRYIIAATPKFTLEKAFFGNPVQKTGNFAVQNKARSLNIFLAIVLWHVQQDEGMTQESAAEYVVRHYSLAIKEETLIRKARKVFDQAINIAHWYTADSAAAAAKSLLAKSPKNKSF